MEHFTNGKINLKHHLNLFRTEKGKFVRVLDFAFVNVSECSCNSRPGNQLWKVFYFGVMYEDAFLSVCKQSL